MLSLGPELSCAHAGARMQDEYKARYYLWQLYQIEQDMAGARSRAADAKERLNEAAKALHAKEQAVEERRKAAAGLAKERLALERRHKKRRADLEKKVTAALLSFLLGHTC